MGSCGLLHLHFSFNLLSGAVFEAKHPVTFEPEPPKCNYSYAHLPINHGKMMSQAGTYSAVMAPPLYGGMVTHCVVVILLALISAPILGINSVMSGCKKYRRNTERERERERGGGGGGGGE